MEPMQPMKPMAAPEIWWPKRLGNPSSSGAQNQMRYAFFPRDAKLLVEIDGRVSAYETGDLQINGVGQQQRDDQTITFSSQNGSVGLGDLKQVDLPD